MKRLTIISLFVLGLIIPNIDVKAITVSNEEELRNAIEQGGDITLTQNIEVTQPLVIDKDVAISGYYDIMMQGDNTLMTINSGNVTLDVGLIAGWNGKYIEWGYPGTDVVKNQGTAVVVNDGNVNFYDALIFAGNFGVEVNGGTVTGWTSIYAGEINYDNNTYSGGQGMIVNGGNAELDDSGIYSGGTALTVNNGANVTLNGADINSYEGNGIEVNDKSVVNINSTKGTTPIFGSKNAIYLNGGSINLNGSIGLSSSTEGKEIYINKGVNVVTGGDVLNLGKDFVFSYLEGTAPNFSIYVNPNIKELRVANENNVFSYENNKLKINFQSNDKTTSNFNQKIGPTTRDIEYIEYNDVIYTNKLSKCMVVYINDEKQNEPDASCNPVAEDENTENNQSPQIVEVPSTSAYGSIIIAVLGIVCVIVSVLVMEKVTKKAN